MLVIHLLAGELCIAGHLILSKRKQLGFLTGEQKSKKSPSHFQYALICNMFLINMRSVQFTDQLPQLTDLPFYRRPSELIFAS